MLSAQRPFTRAASATLAVALMCVAAGMLSSRSPLARAAGTGKLQQQISAGQNRISSLSDAVSQATGRLSKLGSSISSLEGQVARIQANLNAKRAELLKLRAELNAARTRLTQLAAFEARAESVLSRQLISTYETDRPDIVSVVLEARGFNDLLLGDAPVGEKQRTERHPAW